MNGMTHTSLPTPHRMQFESGDNRRLTHYLFRFPAKFHSPVVRHLIEQFTEPGETILDPFCGSGSLLVEAAVANRHAVGIDVDPVAVFVSQVKTLHYNVEELQNTAGRVLQKAHEFERPAWEYKRRQFEDITVRTVQGVLHKEGLEAPDIPNLYHWFRRYVVVDLCRLIACIEGTPAKKRERDFLRLCFASIIRASSNADPVPVSGLEVTAHMRKKDAKGRVINPFALFRRAVANGIKAVAEYMTYAVSGADMRVVQGDVTSTPRRLRQPIDVIITSPPYNMAVNYYRRHQLEMFWLGFTQSQEERLELLPKYIGMDRVAARHPWIANGHVGTQWVHAWEDDIRAVSNDRANAFRHYAVAMSLAFNQMAAVLKPGARAVFVVGHSKWNGKTIPTGELFAELAGKSMELVEHLWYPVKNRYMSYSRRNGANIDREYVLVFQRAAE